MRTTYRSVRTTLSAIMIITALNAGAQSTDCIDTQAANYQMPWKNSGQVSYSHRPNFPKSSLPAVSARMDKIAKVLLEAYPQPKGLECNIRREVVGEGDYYEYKSELAGKVTPFRYSVEGWFFTLHCDSKTGGVKREGETGTTIEFHVNWLHSFMKPIDSHFDGLKLDNGQKMYFMPHIVGELKGYPVYSTEKLTWDKRMQESVTNANRPEESILILPDNRLPVRPVTKEEYINSLKRSQLEMIKETEKNMKEMEDALKESLASYDKMSFNSEAEREKAKTGAKRDVEKGRVYMTKDIERYRSNIAKLNALLESFSPQQRSAQAVIVDATGLLDKADMKAELNNQEKLGRPIVTHDFTYTDPKLPRHAVQFIQVFFKYQTLSRLIAKPEMVKKVKESINLDALKALLERK